MFCEEHTWRNVKHVAARFDNVILANLENQYYYMKTGTMSGKASLRESGYA